MIIVWWKDKWLKWWVVLCIIIVLIFSVDIFVGYIILCNRLFSSGVVSVEIYCLLWNFLFNCCILMVSWKLLLEGLWWIYFFFCSVFSSCCIVVWCRLLSFVSSLMLVLLLSLFNIFNNIRLWVKLCMVLYFVCLLFCILIDIFIVKIMWCIWCIFGYVLIVVENIFFILSV